MRVPAFRHQPFNRTSLESKRLCNRLSSALIPLLIEPVWNQNVSDFRTLGRNSKTFNRTSLESKLKNLSHLFGVIPCILIEPVWNQNCRRVLNSIRFKHGSQYLIEPVWNQNITSFPRILSKKFVSISNRTSLESKRCSKFSTVFVIISVSISNRTSLESKLPRS